MEHIDPDDEIIIGSYEGHRSAKAATVSWWWITMAVYVNRKPFQTNISNVRLSPHLQILELAGILSIINVKVRKIS